MKTIITMVIPWMVIAWDITEWKIMTITGPITKIMITQRIIVIIQDKIKWFQNKNNIIMIA